MYVREKSYGAIISIILLFIAVVVTASTIPTLKDNDVSAHILSPTSDISTRKSSHNPHFPRAPAFQRIPAGTRVTVAHGWTITAHAITSLIVPVQTVAAALESFYQDALVRLATNVITNEPPPGHALRLTIGSVVLEMRAMNPANYLTWEVCEIIVANLWHDAQMGFTSQFQSEWYHPQSGILLYISLGVLQRVGVGPVGEGF